MFPKQKNNKIAKMLSPEETTLLENMQSTISELLSLQTAETGQTPEGENPDKIMETLQKLAENNEQGNEEEEMASKANEGPTANETAEQRAEPKTEINDDNISEVGKSLLTFIAKSVQQKPVQKSYNQNNINIDVIAKAIQTALQPVVAKMQEFETSQNNLFDALGFSEKIEKALDVNKSQDSQKPVQTLDATAVVNELVNVVKGLHGNPQQPNYEVVRDEVGMQQARKNLKSAMKFIFQDKLNKR